ncbi:hypothetical protein JTB14_029568 [Gonioctena quinquepunctata]|nr:hypothetical protein JTB14_029568 [Gonioctena quinquepunctata]
MYLSVATRPDITFVVHFAAQAVSKPRYHHWEIVKRILKYLRGTLGYGIVYEPGEFSLQAFSDSNYADDLSARKSTSRFICKMNQGAITWFSQNQRYVSLSTMEAEYIAGSEAAKEISWLCRLIQKVGPHPEFHKCSKHIDVCYQSITEKALGLQCWQLAIVENRLAIRNTVGTRGTVDPTREEALQVDLEVKSDCNPSSRNAYLEETGSSSTTSVSPLGENAMGVTSKQNGLRRDGSNSGNIEKRDRKGSVKTLLSSSERQYLVLTQSEFEQKQLGGGRDTANAARIPK